MGTNALDDRRGGVDVVLTNLSIGIPLDQDFIGDLLLPPLRQTLSKVDIPVWGTEAWRIREDRVGDYSQPDKLDISLGLTNVTVDGHALEAPVSDRHAQESQQGPLKVDLRFQALQTVVANMRLAREKMQADLMTSTSIYTASTNKFDLNTTGVAVASNHQWDNPANNPFDDIIPLMESNIPNGSGKRPNTFWMGQAVWAAFIQNQKVKDTIFGLNGPQGIPTLDAVAKIIGIDRILVGRAISKTAGGVVTKLWGKNAGLLYVPPTSGERVPAFGYTVEQTVFGGASEKVVTIRDEHMGASGGEWVKRSSFYTPVSTFADAGALLYNAIA